MAQTSATATPRMLAAAAANMGTADFSNSAPIATQSAKRQDTGRRDMSQIVPAYDEHEDALREALTALTALTSTRINGAVPWRASPSS